MTYDILATDSSRFAVLVVNKKCEIRGIVEKPEVLTCSDGFLRYRGKDGKIVDELTTKITGPVTRVGVID